MKPLSNQIMLITYADSLGRNLRELHEVLDRPRETGALRSRPIARSTRPLAAGMTSARWQTAIILWRTT